MPEPIRYPLAITADDFNKAYALAMRHRKTPWQVLVVLFIFLGIGFMVMFLPARSEHRPVPAPVPSPAQGSESTLGDVFSIMLMAALFIGFWFFILRQSRWGSKKTTREPVDHLIDDDGIHIHSPSEETHIKWSQFSRALEDRHAFVLIVNLDDALLNIHIIPKRVVPDEETQARLRALIETHVGPVNTKPVPAPR